MAGVEPNQHVHLERGFAKTSAQKEHQIMVILILNLYFDMFFVRQTCIFNSVVCVIALGVKCHWKPLVNWELNQPGFLDFYFVDVSDTWFKSWDGYPMVIHGDISHSFFGAQVPAKPVLFQWIYTWFCFTTSGVVPRSLNSHSFPMVGWAFIW